MPPGTKLFDFTWTFGHLGQIWERIIQHFELIVVPLLLGIVISLVLAVWAAGKIFRTGLLMHGKSATPAEMLRWVRAK